MVSRTHLTVALAGALFLAACAYVGYANELLKAAVAPSHRVVLIIGFILGAGAVSRWILTLNIKRTMGKIKRLRAGRK